jgi:hypothetical protein
MRKILIILSLSFLLVACENEISKEIASIKMRAFAPRCVSHGPSICIEVGGPNVKLHLNSMQATPPNRCVSPGDTVEMEIVPRPSAAATVFVVPKNLRDTWLIGTNYPDKDKIIITIPTSVRRYSDHDYGFLTNNGKCADPRFHVE